MTTITRKHRQQSARVILLLAALAVSGIQCKPPLSSGATPVSYIRLLATDSPVATAATPLSLLSPLIVMRPSSDGNLLFLYTAHTPGDSATSIELTKTDVNGNVLWTQHFGGADNYEAGDCLSLPDGTIAVVGTHILASNYGQVALFLLDANGMVSLDKEYPFTNLPNLSVCTLRLGDTNDFVIGCQSKDPDVTGTSASELEFLRISSTGDSLNYNNLSYNTPNVGYGLTDMSTISDGIGIAVGPWLETPPYLNRTFYQWNSPDSLSVIGDFTTKTGTLHSIARTGTSSYIVAGDSADFGTAPPLPPHTPWIAQAGPTFSQGMNPVWSRAIRPGLVGSITNIIQSADGGLAATGYIVPTVEDTSIAVFRFDAKGNDVWPYKTYSFDGGDAPNDIIELPNGDLIIGGVTTSFGSRASGARQIFLLHLKSDGTPAS